MLPQLRSRVGRHTPRVMAFAPLHRTLDPSFGGRARCGTQAVVLPRMAALLARLVTRVNAANPCTDTFHVADCGLNRSVHCDAERRAQPRRGEPLTMSTKQTNENPKPPLAVAAGSESDALIIAFVQGAAWWEYHQTKATMWGSDRERADIEARWKLAHGSLGKPFPNSMFGTKSQV